MLEWFWLLLPAWLMGSLLVFITAPLGCLMLWRRMAFFADTMAHGTLLGVAMAALLQLPFAVGVALMALALVALLWGLHDSRLPNDALLALCSSSLLCTGLILIQQLPTLRPELLSYLFGDLLSVAWQDLPLFLLVIALACSVIIYFWRAQLLWAIDPEIAVSEGIHAGRQRLLFMLLLALFTVMALKAVGSLLMGALLVIPALSARLLSRSPRHMLIWAFVLAQLAIAVGLWGSAWLNLASGLSIVLCMALIFALIFVAQKIWRWQRASAYH